MAHEHPDRDTPGWSNPDFCPFCGEGLSDPGVGFIDHLDESSACRERFEEWREYVTEDIGSEWGA